jgi:hypothetical protein
MGIKGSVKRGLDGHFIHANCDTDIIVGEEPPLGSTAKPEELYQIYVLSDMSSVEAVTTHAAKAEEELLSTGAVDLVRRAVRAPCVLPSGVRDIQVALQGGQAFRVAALPADGTLAAGYAELQERLKTREIPRQLLRKCRLGDSDLRGTVLQQMIWRTNEFEMHLTFDGHCPEGKAVEVYSFVKDHELKLFVPFRMPLKCAGFQHPAQSSDSFLKRLAGIVTFSS